MHTREIELKPEGEEPARLIIVIDAPLVVATIILPAAGKLPGVASGIAICHAGDEFNEITGMRLAVNRACNINGDWWVRKYPQYYSEFRRFLWLEEMRKEQRKILEELYRIGQRCGCCAPQETSMFVITYPIAESGKTMTVEYEAKAKKENE